MYSIIYCFSVVYIVVHTIKVLFVYCIIFFQYIAETVLSISRVSVGCGVPQLQTRALDWKPVIAGQSACSCQRALCLDAVQCRQVATPFPSLSPSPFHQLAKHFFFFRSPWQEEAGRVGWASPCAGTFSEMRHVSNSVCFSLFV